MQYKVVADGKRKIWLTADTHLGESRFEIMSRPFTDIDEHVSHLLHQHNRLVSREDLVIHVGDVCYQHNPSYLTYINYFHGEKILVRGNHNRVFSDEQLKPYFTTIVPEGEGIEIEGLDFRVYATHYPTHGRVDCFNAVGHIHSAWKVQLNMVNVGVDVTHFKPTPIELLRFYYMAVKDFHDDDVWVAYQPVNAEYHGKREKPGSYFKPGEKR